MIMDELREKYGDATVLGVAEEHIKGALRDGFTAIKDAEDLEATLQQYLGKAS